MAEVNSKSSGEQKHHEYTREDIKDLMSSLFSMKAEVARIEAEAKPIKEEIKKIEGVVLSLLEVDEKIAHKGLGTISVKEEEVPNVEDWDKVYRHIQENGAFYLLSRRLLAAPYREMLDQGLDLPGVTTTTIRKLSVRKS